MKINEDNFIEEMRKSNLRVLDYIVDNYSSLIFKVAFSILYDRELAKECVNEALIKIWNNRDKFNYEKGKFTTFIIVITKRIAIDIYRKESKNFSNVDIEDFNIKDRLSVEDSILSKELKQEIINEINTMDKVNKEIFLRRFFLGESIKNIAKFFDLSESAVSNRLLRGRKQLLSKFKEGEVK